LLSPDGIHGVQLLGTRKLSDAVAKDAVLMRRVQEGNHDAFRTLFDRHSPAILRFLIARVGRNSAEDLLIETFASAWRSAESFAAVDARPWLCGIATNKIRGHREQELRWQQSIRRSAEISPGPASEDPDVGLSTGLSQALASLSFAERELILLVAFADVTAAEAARMLGISPVAARMRLLRARRCLTTLLGSHQIGDGHGTQ
jgi:RNA polymerase sigma-70 factor (ECF subfamily)